MIRVMVVPVSGEVEFKEIDETELTDYFAIVDGPLQAVELLNPAGSIYVDEEGKLSQLPANYRATKLWWSLNPLYWDQDTLCGTAIVVGPVDELGNDTDVPPIFGRIVAGLEDFRVDVLAIGEVKWSTNSIGFPECKDAIEYAENLRGRWTAVDQMRVVPRSAVPENEVYVHGSENV